VNRTALAGVLLVALAAGPGLAGCDGGGNGGGAGGPAASPTVMTDAQILTTGKELAQCIRDHGLPGFPDPGVENGRLTLPDGLEDNLPPNAEQAMDACRSIMDRLPASALGESEKEGETGRAPMDPADLPKARRWAQCVREHGIADLPDPGSDGKINIRGTSLAAEGKSERVRRAFQACDEHLVPGISLNG
jgi:hypothetical protein